jgi:MFS family permease
MVGKNAGSDGYFWSGTVPRMHLRLFHWWVGCGSYRPHQWHLLRLLLRLDRRCTAAATQNLELILVARVITGIGTGALTGITPVLISEVSASDHRGGFLGYIFIANYLDDSVAYWLPLGPAFINDGHSDVRWRFLLAFQCFQALLLLAGIKVLPDSSRFYAPVGQFEKAKEVLIQFRGSFAPAVEDEYLEICALEADSKPASPLQFAKVLMGRCEAKRLTWAGVLGFAFGYRSCLPGLVSPPSQPTRLCSSFKLDIAR